MHIRSRTTLGIQRLGILFSVALFAHNALWAQVSGSAGWGGIGDPAMAPGSPSQSYSLSAIDQVNYYNGLVNITIPTYTLGGRGSATVPTTLAIQKQWTMYDATSPYTAQYEPSLSFSGPLNGSPALSFVTNSSSAASCPGGQSFVTYLAYITSAGTPVILRDAVYNGQPQCPTASGEIITGYADRGTVFQSSDGTNLTFVSNSDVSDGSTRGEPQGPQGVLITRNGTRYSIDYYPLQPSPGAFGILGVEDRNGNVINFSNQKDSSGNFTVTATDSVGRSIADWTPTANNAPNTITYPGAGGASRTITANYSTLTGANALAWGESAQPVSSLFPELTGNDNNWTAAQQQVLTSVVLADGVSTYTLQYNAYGEVTRLTLPTGGVYAYKYPEAYAGTGDGVIALSGGGYTINRRLLERDEYADGVHISAKMLLAMTSQATGLDPNHSSRPGTIATITFQDGNSNTLRVEKHYFYGNPQSTTPDPANPTQFADWWFGLEFRTDVLDGTGKLLQSIQRVYNQRPCAQGENCWYDPQSDSAPAHDPQLCQVNTTNDAGQVSTVALQYDQYNNVTDKYEFDFGAALTLGASCPTSFTGALRHTHSTFVTGAYVVPTVNILNLPASTTVYNSAGTQVAAASFTYDGAAPTDDPGIAGHDSAYGTGLRRAATLRA